MWSRFDDSKNASLIDEVGGELGHVDEVHIQQPTAEKAGEVYDKLRKFCTTCGSLTHLAATCNYQAPEDAHLQLPAPIPEPNFEENLGHDNQSDARPITPTEAADDTMGETVGSNLNMEISENQINNDSHGEFMDFMHPGDIQDRINETFAVREVGTASVPVQTRGTKRKDITTTDADEVSTSNKRAQARPTPQDKGEDINRKYRIDILFLVETKNKDAYVQSLGVDLHFDHQILVSPDGLSGGLAIFWRNTVKCDFLSPPTLNYTDMYITEGNTTFCLSYVYGNPERKPRQQMWQMMENFIRGGLYQSKPRLVLGDFNEIKNNMEKLGGPSRPEWQFLNFRRMLNVSGLHEIKTFGGIYTWIGNRSAGTIKSRLDRAVATADWKEIFPKAMVQLLEWIGSDHKPLLLHTEDNKWKGMKLFRYDNRWRHNQEVQKTIQNTWSQQCSQLPPQQFHEALKRCRNSLSSWKSEQNNNSSKKIQQLHIALKQAYDSPSPDYNYITNLKGQLQQEYRLEEEFWRTKSRVLWMQAGDKNTRYFHAKTKQRRSHNRITALEDEAGNIKQTDKEIQNIIHSYFTNLYSSSGSDQLDMVLQHIQPRVTAQMNQQLTAPVTEEEIFKALAQMNVDKAPGPDGFNAGFFKYHWQAIKSGVIKFIQHFFETGDLNPELNHTYICLVPKIDSPTQVKDFRPISLCNIAYKLISKVMADRLKPWLHLLISEFQSAFIPGRLITDNIIVTHELLHSLRTKKIKSPFMALKLDIAKAFDKVEWIYIEAMLRRLGFADQWCRWVMKCITSVSYSVLLNGSPTKKIIPSRGLRQGDPLSPYLYLICTEGLSSLLTHAMQSNLIHGFKASRDGPSISHMFFADDSLLFCQANEGESEKLLSLLQAYAKASGQHVNFQKSAILFGKNVPLAVQQNIMNMTGISKSGGFGKYLGLPEAIGRNKYDTFAFISQRVQQKLHSWYSNFLSMAGKEVLIKFIATALPTYTMSCFMLPKRLLSQITGQIRRFWWSSIRDKHKIPWIAWSKMTALKQYGGMGFRDLNHFNVALVAKQSWRMLKEPQLLLTRVLKAKYFSKVSLMEAKLGHRPSHAWRSILQGMQLIKQGLRWNIGDGNNIKAWHDPWLSNPPRPTRCLISSTPDQLTVSGLMHSSSNTWDVKKLQELVHPEDIPIIKKIRTRIIKCQDTPKWIFTRDGNYTVKSGYHQLIKPGIEQLSNNPAVNALWKQIWVLNVQPKIKHFWWRVLHNALPVGSTLAQRRIKIMPDCVFCGEATETIVHILFHCRVAKEIWELSPLQVDTDASWIDPHSSAGIGWVLLNPQHRCILRGFSSIDPTSSVLEAEAIALREALFHLRRLNYSNVIFCGDSLSLYQHLENTAKQYHQASGYLEIQTYLDDIHALALGSYSFKFISRNENCMADLLAKNARQQNSPLTISWD
ncbi:Ribonuclease H domain [Arabidopsis thaliana x Arabidopsis arenosa]|uniref:Ribonuclease H domain n=1 Tax=Arabidopsis thaliana x Arabidopsis arenosa TaxID=1240361 RepID=A0A8T2BIA2_9BRAS|nr:Ribonuclease H domain [Arabidopsis thaliana x Arabidopsis arenosa]